MMKKILICSGFLPSNINEKVYYNSPAENNFINGLAKELNEYANIEFLSYIAYELEKEQKEKINDLLNTKQMKCIYKRKKNIINYFIYYFNLVLKLRTIDYIVLYGINKTSIFIPIISRVMSKKCIIILSDYTNANEETTIIKKIIAKIFLKTFKEFNGVVFLSSLLMNSVEVKKSILINGGVREEEFVDFKKPTYQNTINIFYSGLLSEVTGVDLLIEVIKKFDFEKYKNVNFIITGKGSLENEVREISDSINNVKYYGFVSRKKYLEYLKEANILLNPRNMHLEQNKNNFPSKIIEYIASGRMIVSTKFAGYESFTENVILVDTDIKEIKRTLEKTIDNYLKLHSDIFEKNREKIKNYYWKEQCKRLYNFLLSV